MPTRAAVWFLVVLSSAPACGGILSIQEAENSTIVCAAGNSPHKDPWASNGAMAPASWGDTEGDLIEWGFNLVEPVADAWLGVRYAFDETSFLRAKKRAKNPASSHTLRLRINNGKPIVVPIPDTGGWNHYEVSHVQLPAMGAGWTVLHLYSPAAGSCVNLDCCTIYTGTVDADAPGPLRPTRLLRSARQHFQVCATPQAVLPAAPREIADSFDQLYEMMSAEYGTKPPTPIWVHFADPVHWSHGSRRFIRNRFGIYLLADNSTPDRTGWCLTVADVFGAVPVPRWFFHSVARSRTEMEWLPAVDASGLPQAARDMLVREARELLDNPQMAARRPEVVHAAVCLKCGPDMFADFWRLAAAEADGGNAPLTTDAVLALLSRAAGEDLAPLYRRWPGLAIEGPVEPVTFNR